MVASAPSASSDLIEVRADGVGHALHRNGAEVFSDPSLGEVQRVLRHEIIRSFIRKRRDLLWLHAGAAIQDGKAVLFVAPYGRGKSTLVTELCARGWSYASDDIVPVDLATGRILPFPLTPFVRQGIGMHLPADRLGELRKVPISLAHEAFHCDAVEIGAIVLPTFHAGSRAAVADYRPAEVVLDIMREVISDGHHGEAAVALCTRLVSEVPILPLGFSEPGPAADLIIATLRWVAHSPIDAHAPAATSLRSA
jgi:hypothetical protein